MIHLTRAELLKKVTSKLRLLTFTGWLMSHIPVMSLFFCCRSDWRDLISCSLSSNTSAILRGERDTNGSDAGCVWTRRSRDKPHNWNVSVLDYFSCCSWRASWFFLRESLCLVSEMWAACSSFSSRSLSFNLHRRTTLYTPRHPREPAHTMPLCPPLF